MLLVVAALIAAAVVVDPSAAAVEVTGASACPSAADVAAALPGLIGPKDPGAPADQATVTDDGTGVTVALRRASGEPVAEKRLDAGLSCEQRARAAAVVLAAWEARLATQTGALAVPPVAPPAPPAPPPGPSPTVIREQPQAAPEPIVVEPGIGLGASINGTTTAPAATVDVAFSRPDGLLVPAVAALIVGAHSKSVGPGDGSWRRYGLLATVGSRRTWSATWLDARVGVAATLLDISGSSFQTNHGGVTFDPGIPIGARFGLRTRPVRWWIDATVAFWPRAQTLTVMGVAASTTLPRAEALLGVGASYGGR